MLDNVIAFLMKTEVLIGIAIAILIIVALLVFMSMRKKSLLKQVHDLEIAINGLRSTPLTPKMNKAIGLAKVNPDIQERVDAAQEHFIEVNSLHERLTNLLGNAEDELLTGHTSQAKNTMNEINTLFQQAQNVTQHLDKELDTMLEDEIRLRDDINNIKSEYRMVKTEYENKANVLALAADELESKLEAIAIKFDDFERWMYSSQFTNAQDVYKEIKELVAQFRKYLYNLPALIEKATGIIPHLLKEIHALNQEALSKGVFLQHLEVGRNLDLVEATLKEEVTNISQLQIEATSDRLDDMQKRLQQLMSAIQKESKALEQVMSLKVTTFSQQEQVSHNLQVLLKELPALKERFGFAELASDLSNFEAQDAAIQQAAVRLNEKLLNEQLPYSALLIEVNEFVQDVTLLQSNLQQAYRLIQSVRQDEQRAHQQLLKLSLLLNDIQVKIEARHLPQIAKNYEGDMHSAGMRLNQIKQILAINPLNVNLLNTAVNDAIDVIYKLYNNVNNLIGTVDMVENAIVYGNKYRSESSQLDSELTRAEVSFRNGEYTYALNIVISAIESFKPGSKYEELIVQNSQSG